MLTAAYKYIKIQLFYPDEDLRTLSRMMLLAHALEKHSTGRQSQHDLNDLTNKRSRTFTCHVVGFCNPPQFAAIYGLFRNINL